MAQEYEGVEMRYARIFEENEALKAENRRLKAELEKQRGIVQKQYHTITVLQDAIIGQAVLIGMAVGEREDEDEAQ
jgi:regulator of replication initiation timing